jgi:outer membrane immunogenic protein
MILAVTASALLVSFEPAGATDLWEVPQPSTPSLKDSPYDFSPLWQGFYLGGHAGGAWGNASILDNFTYVGDPSFDGRLGGAGFIGGAEAGYNIQRGHFVFGVEGDVGYLGLSAGKSVGFRPASCVGNYNAAPFTVMYNAQNGNQQLCDIDARYSFSSDAYGDLTGRLGYAIDRTLFYVKGGAAFLNADFKATYTGQSCVTAGTCPGATHQGPSTFNFNSSDTLAGWTVGVGIEHALSRSWSVKVEYQHFDFGSLSYSYSGCVNLGVNGGGGCPIGNGLPGHYTSNIRGSADVSLTADAVMVGLNYHLDN